MRYSLAFVFPFFFFALSAQKNSRCEIFQYFGNDSANQSLAQVIIYNERGQMISQQYINWKVSEAEGTENGTYTFVYSDTFLVKRYFGSEDGDSSRTEYVYDAKGKLSQQKLFELKTISNSGGYIRPGDGANANMGRRWEQTSEVNFIYDMKGRKITYDATRLHYTAQNMYTWEYDDKNRVTVQKSYSRGRVTWREDYQYFDWGYRYWRIWYDESGNPRNENKESYAYWPLLFFTYTVDAQGRVIRENISDENKKLHGRTDFYYQKNGKLLRTEYFNEKDVLSVTHRYVYS